MNTTLPEITDLFARLALNLRTPTEISRVNNANEQEEPVDLSISKLNQYLNIDYGETSSLRVLDTALSLMCFKAPQVFDSAVEYSVKTIITVLSASITCKALRLWSEEVLLVGGSISSYDSLKLIEACGGIVGKLKGHGELSHLLLHSVLKVAVSATYSHHLFPLIPTVDSRLIDRRSTTVSNLLCHLPGKIYLKKEEIPLRLLFWHLDPLILKRDVSKILQESMDRPFLYLKDELHKRIDWWSVIICLALSPIMFIETKDLLHNWFLMTGLASVLEFSIQLVSVTLDVLYRPTWWGIPVELGSLLPFSGAYFPRNSNLLRILAGPLLSESLLHLVKAIDKKPCNGAGERVDETSKAVAMTVSLIDHKSMWALAMKFPDWFYFASVLLFSEKGFLDKCCSNVTSLSFETAHTTNDMQRHSLRATAARYIAWILIPATKSYQDLLIDALTQISDSWARKHFVTDAHPRGAAGNRKKLKKPKANDNKERNTLLKEYDCHDVALWLKEFQNIYMIYGNKSVKKSEVKPSYSLNQHQNAMLRRIIFGIIIGCSSFVTESGCELLLHYVTTGRILKPTESKNSETNYVKWNIKGQDPIIRGEEYGKKEAVQGASHVFALTDVIDIMSSSLFETEESVVDLIFNVKIRALRYLIKSIQKLLHLGIDEDGKLMLVDLTNRLIRWRHQGREISVGHKELDDIINGLNHKLSSL